MVYKISSSDHYINWDATGEERIAQNVLNILRIRKREVPFMPDLGLRPENIDDLMHSITHSIKDEVIEAVNKWESRAEVIDVYVKAIDTDGGMEIIVELEV